MAGAAIQFAYSAGIIVAAAIVLTRCADAIAERTGLGRLLVGSVFLAAATSLPELATDLHAIWLDSADVAVGDLMGSSLFNLLILAIADLVHRSPGLLLSRVAAAHALSGTVTIALTALAGISILAESKLSDRFAMGFSPGALVLLVAYVFGIRLVYYDQRAAAAESSKQRRLAAAGVMTLRAAISGYLLATVIILIAAAWLAQAASQLAQISGLGGTFVGTTLVAFATSLPELVATLTAVRLAAYDLAIGNIFGSNAFNMLLLLPLDWAQPGSLLATVSSTHALTCFAVVLITAVVILGQLYQVERRVFFIEPDAGLVVALVVGALVMLYFVR